MCVGHQGGGSHPTLRKGTRQCDDAVPRLAIPERPTHFGAMHRRTFVCAALAIAPLGAALAQDGVQPAPIAHARLQVILDDAEALTRLETVIVSHNGSVLAERGYRGRSTEAATNIKSASKSIISALVGIAIDRGGSAGAGAADRSASHA